MGTELRKTKFAGLLEHDLLNCGILSVKLNISMKLVSAKSLFKRVGVFNKYDLRLEMNSQRSKKISSLSTH